MINSIKTFIKDLIASKEYKKAWNSVPMNSLPITNNDSLRMYVLVRRESLPMIHCAVQTAHSICEYQMEHRCDVYKKWASQDKTLILLEATLQDILDMQDYCKIKKINCSQFLEPDINLVTALAIQPMTKSEGKILFGKFKLLS